MEAVKDKLVLYNPVTLKFWACSNWQFRKMQKKKKKERSYGSKMSKILLIIIPWLHYHSLSLESESKKRIGNEASTMSRLSNRVWTKQQTDCTHQGHGVQSLCAVLLLVWKQVLETLCPPGTLERFPFVRTGRPDKSFRKWNGLFPEGFAEKPSPSSGFLLDPGRQDLYSVISILVPAILSGGAYRYL